MKKLLSAVASLAGFLSLHAAPSAYAVVVESYPELEIVAIQDLPMSMPGSLFRSIDPDEKFPVAGSYPASLNVFLVRDKKSGKNALIDAGYGKAESRLTEQLALLKLNPEDISDIFITHIHPDHVGGLSTPDGRAVFPNARIHIARKEYEEWKNDPARAALARHLVPNRKNLTLTDYGEEAAPYGLVPLHYPGHTPGHTVFRMKLTLPERTEKTIHFVGDIVHASELQIPRPNFCARFDMSPETAVRSRRKLLNAAAYWYGAHLPFPGIVRIDRRDNGSAGSEARQNKDPDRML